VTDFIFIEHAVKLTPITGIYGIAVATFWPLILAVQQYRKGYGVLGVLRALTGVELAYRCAL
jgi:hypothetical protein